MGEIHDLHCNKCGYGIKAMLGIGMMYSPDNVFYRNQPILSELVSDDKISEIALKKIQNGEKPADNYGHRLYACPNDFFLYDKFYFKIGSFEPEYACPYGDGKLQRVDFAKGKLGTTRLKFVGQDKYWQCPRCGNDAMIEASFGNWD